MFRSSVPDREGSYTVVEQLIRATEDRIQDRTDFSAVAHQIMEIEQQVQVAPSVPSPASKVSFPTVLGCVVGN